jgi:hypothetical protein
MGCRKDSDSNITASLFEAKMKKTSTNIHQLLEEKRIRYGKDREVMTTADQESFMNESEATQMVQPLIDPSASFLQSYYNINIYEYFPAGSPNIARLGAIALRFKQMEEQGLAVDTNQVDSWFPSAPELVSQANGELLTNVAEASVVECALEALGIPAALIVGSAKSLSRAALLKAARKLLTRTVGWIGVAIMIYDFGDCMNWW